VIAHIREIQAENNNIQTSSYHLSTAWLIIKWTIEETGRLPQIKRQHKANHNREIPSVWFYFHSKSTEKRVIKNTRG
jgi:hypothetical protein